MTITRMDAGPIGSLVALTLYVGAILTAEGSLITVAIAATKLVVLPLLAIVIGGLVGEKVYDAVHYYRSRTHASETE